MKENKKEVLFLLSEEKIINLDINLLIPNPYQPRKTFNPSSIKELAISIEKYGILNPILVRKKDNSYEIIAGERRYRAAKSLGLTTIPAIVKEIDDAKMAELALIENLQRENLNPIEEAKSYQQIINLTNITQNTLASTLGKTQSFISNKIRLLSLPEEIQEAISDKKISERHAKSLMTVESKNRQLELLNQIIDKKLTVKELDNIINEEKITQDEIKMTISNIMESIKKEEKESDNMNNGNFFPNLNNQMNQNTSLNSLNMQSMNEPPVAPIIEPTIAPSPVPTQNSIPSVNPIPTPEPVVPTPPVDNFQPLFNNEAVNPIPDFNNNINNQLQEPINQQPVNQEISTVTEEMTAFEPSVSVEPSSPVKPQQPLFPEEPINELSNLANQNFMNNTVEPNIKSEVVQEAPLFSVPEITPTVQSNNVNPTFEVPVSTPEPEPAPDNLTKTTDFLNQNNIPYKLYNNETGHCIIIEI